MNLSQTDYKKIINYYELSKSNNKSNKELAEDVLALKLCKCIKKTRALIVIIMRMKKGQ